MHDSKVDNAEDVARAIFFPVMVDASGKVTKAAFYLRHNESYFSVARMSVDSWKKDILAIPQNEEHKLIGYAKMNVGAIRGLDLSFFGKQISLDVKSYSSQRNESHAGIVVTYDNATLKGDKVRILKPIPEGTPASMILLKIQNQLAKLADKGLVIDVLVEKDVAI